MRSRGKNFLEGDPANGFAPLCQIHTCLKSYLYVKLFLSKLLHNTYWFQTRLQPAFFIFILTVRHGIGKLVRTSRDGMYWEQITTVIFKFKMQRLLLFSLAPCRESLLMPHACWSPWKNSFLLLNHITRCTHQKLLKLHAAMVCWITQRQLLNNYSVRPFVGNLNK